jgi:hypothetical protein
MTPATSFATDTRNAPIRFACTGDYGLRNPECCS